MRVVALASKEYEDADVTAVVEKRTTFMLGSAYFPSFFAIVQVWVAPLTAKIPDHSNDSGALDLVLAFK
jgi:hypothetical protein